AAAELSRRARPGGPAAAGDDPGAGRRARRGGRTGHGEARPHPGRDRPRPRADPVGGRLEAPPARPGPGPVSVNIAILGGTGKEGAGLGARWALAGHAIVIGSRDAGRAKTKAAELRELTRKIPIIDRKSTRLNSSH